MRAVRLTAWQSTPKIVEVPDPKPGPGEVLLKVTSAGVCHSDLHLMEWPAGALPFEPPFTLGHEAAGVVAGFGAGVTGVTEGDGYVVYGSWGCGNCHECAQGRENYCRRAAELGTFGGGLGSDGAMADYVIVPQSRWLVPLGDLDPVTSAPVTDAVLTPYHAVKRCLPKLVPGSHAVVIGVGGLGHMAVQLLRVLSPATVIAVDLDADKLALAAEVGAHHALRSDDSTGTGTVAAAIRDITEGHGAEVVVDCVGAQSTVALGAQVVAVAGELSIVGLAGGVLPVAFGAIPWEVSAYVPYWGTRPELVEAVELLRSGAIAMHVEAFPLAAALDVYELLRKGGVRGRAVLVPS